MSIALLGVLPAWSSAALLGVHASPRGEVRLHTEACPSGKGQRAVRKLPGSRTSEGCWQVDEDSNPVVVWRDGGKQVLDGNRVRLEPAFAALLQPPSPGREAASARKAPATARSWDRPRWCANARFPHERLVCADPSLSAADLALSPLWRRYQEKLEPGTRAWVKRDYFLRLKACGARRDCVAREQDAQRRLYLAALAPRGNGASSPPARR